MDQASMERYVAGRSEVMQHEPGYLLFKFSQVQMALVSDTTHDRMRIIAPVLSYDELDEAAKDAVMEANFRSALDARYAVSNGVLYAAFIHPLSGLNEAQLQSAMDQVANLTHTYGSSYSSGQLVYGEVAGENEPHTQQ